MFGKNPIRKLDRTPEDGKLAVQEIFYTIQGEGPFTGVPAVFIRLAGCHLACTFCDTEFESGINDRRTVEELATLAANMVPKTLHKIPIVVLTGGEPMRQRLAPLVGLLFDKGFEVVQIETAGNFWEPELLGFGYRLVFVCSPKTNHVHPEMAEHCANWKYVVRHNQVGVDGLPTEPTQANSTQPPWNVIAHVALTKAFDNIWISPCDDHDTTQNALNVKQAVEVCLKHGYRLSLQTHKIVNVP